MRPDKIYAPDMPDKSKIVVYTMRESNGRISQAIFAYLNHPEITKLWNEFKAETNVDNTSVLYQDYDFVNGSWSINLNTTDENKMIGVQTELIKYINCDDFTIYQSPEGYLIVFNTNKNQSKILDFLIAIPEVEPDMWRMIPIAWETKR